MIQKIKIHVSKLLGKLKQVWHLAGIQLIYITLGSLWLIVDFLKNVYETVQLKLKQSDLSVNLEIESNHNETRDTNTNSICLLSVFKLQVLVLLIACTLNFFACLYMRKTNQDKEFFKRMTKEINQDAKQRWLYRILLLTGFGHTYFLIFKSCSAYKRLQGKNFKEKLINNSLEFEEEIYLDTLKLLRAIYEDIPFLFIYLVILSRYEKTTGLTFRLANIAKVLWQFLAHFQEIEEILAHF